MYDYTPFWMMHVYISSFNIIINRLAGSTGDKHLDSKKRKRELSKKWVLYEDELYLCAVSRQNVTIMPLHNFLSFAALNKLCVSVISFKPCPVFHLLNLKHRYPVLLQKGPDATCHPLSLHDLDQTNKWSLLSSLDRFKSVYAKLSVMDLFTTFYPFPMDPMSRVSPWSTVIFIADLPANYIPWFH